MLVYIKPLSTFPKLHSDKLFGAILSAISEIFDDEILTNLINDFDNNPPFLISSAFPAIKTKKGFKRFFPRIITNNNSKVIVNPDNFKKFKKVEYFEEDIFFDLINGKLSEDEILENYSKYTQIDNLFMHKNNEIEIEIKNTVRPNNAVNRLNNKTDIFYSEGIEYGKNIRLFFFIEIYDEKYESIIKSALKFLKDRGFGKDISTGKGQFDYNIENVSISELNILGNSSRFVTLSRFIPKEDEVKKLDEKSCYELGFKRSRDKNGKVRKQIRFFKEGSTFNCYCDSSYGHIVDVTENKSAFEYGYAFPLFFKHEGD